MGKIASAGLAILLLLAPCFASGHGGGEAAKPPAKDSPRKDNAHVTTTSQSYIGFEPLYTTIITGDSAAGMLMIGIGIDVPDADLRAKVKAMLPALRDLYVRSLLYYAAAKIRPWRQPDAIAIADKLQRVTDKFLKRRGVKVLLAQVAVRLNK